MYDVIIIGKGPAGISAALYTARANLKTLLVGSEDSQLLKTDKIENYYGFAKPITGKYLFEEGIKQIKNIGVEILDDKILGISYGEKGYEIETNFGKKIALSVIICAGQSSKKIGIKNIVEYEGKGVSYCTTCDGFFFRDKKLGVLGNKDYAIYEAEELKAFTKDITIFTNGNGLDISDKYKEVVKGFSVNNDKIISLYGENKLEGLVFDNKKKEMIDGLFVAYESASSTDFALKLGLEVENKSIKTDEKQKTNIPGIFAAGDCTSAFKQISVAVGQGAIAGRSVIEYIRSIKAK